MTPEEAIKTIQVAVAEVEWNYPMNYAVAFETAIEALEKQVPKKPRRVTMELTDTQRFFCPSCEEKLISKINHQYIAGKVQNYCDNCGQKLSWETDT